MRNEKTAALKDLIRQPYAWPGGYPKYAVMQDGGALCHKCAKDEYYLVLRATRDADHSGWEFAGVDINWEDGELYCDHCGAKIESAYGDE